MEKLEFYRKGVLVQPPDNWKELSVKLNYDRDKGRFEQQTSLTDLEWVIDNATLTRAHQQGGIDGTSAGVFEGIPFKIKVTDGANSDFIFNGYEDLTDGAIFSKIRSQVKAKELNSIDFLRDVADGFTMEYLYKALSTGDPGKISASDFVHVPYILNSVPDYLHAAISILSIFIIVEEIKAAVEKMTELATEMTNPFEATSIVRTVLYIAYLIGLITSLIILVKDFMQLIIQPVKYHAGMFLLDQLKKGAQYLGKTFSCPILEAAPWSKLFIIPQKPESIPNTDDPRILGFTTPNTAGAQEGFFKGTYGDLLRAAKSIIRGKLIVTDTQITLLREDQAAGTPQFQLKDYLIKGDEFTINTDEFKSNYSIEFLTDATDKNTIQQFQGTIYQRITQPNYTVNPEMKLMKGLEEIRIPFALAKRKEELTVPEEIVKAFLDVFSFIANALISVVNALIDAYNSVVGVLNSIIDALDFIGIDLGFDIPTIPAVPYIDLGAIIENRLGMLMIEIDAIMQPKLMLLNKGSQPKYTKIDPDNRTTLSCKRLYEEFHFITSFVPSAARPAGNQYKKRELKNVQFCYGDYLKVRNNNFIFDFEGNMVEIDALDWNIAGQRADIVYRKNEIYTLNLTETFLEPDGK